MRFVKNGFALCATLISLSLAAGCNNNYENSSSELTSDISYDISDSLVNFEEDQPDKLAELQQRIQDNGCAAGVAIVDYADSELSEDELSAFFKSSLIAQDYPFLCQSKVIAYDGSELFAIVPANSETTITIYRGEFTENAEYEAITDDVIFKGKKGESVVIRCNVSDIIANTVVVVANGEEKMKFCPQLSLRDAWCLSTAEGCYDFSPDNSRRN